MLEYRTGMGHDIHRLVPGKNLVLGGVSIPAEKFRIVGRPQVEDVVPVTTPISSIATPTVLYAPTWRGHVEETMLYSLPSGERIVSALLERGATVIFRPHPFSYDLATMRPRSPRSSRCWRPTPAGPADRICGAPPRSPNAASSTASTPPTR